MSIWLPDRAVLAQTLKEAIKSGTQMFDPKGSSATMYYSEIYINAKNINLRCFMLWQQILYITLNMIEDHWGHCWLFQNNDIGGELLSQKRATILFVKRSESWRNRD